MGRFLDRIWNRFKHQEKKGYEKYKMYLEDNNDDVDLRLEHLAQELTDSLMYIEWIREKMYLEDNNDDVDLRLEHLAQELTDSLMYIEWIREKLREDRG